MAHFAEIDENGTVLRVLAVANDAITDEEGNESKAIAIDFMRETFADSFQWIQTSFNAATNGFRGKFAGIGDNWDGSQFIAPSAPSIEETP